MIFSVIMKALGAEVKEDEFNVSSLVPTNAKW